VLVYLIGPYTFLGQLFGEHLTDSLVGVVIAMSFVSSPFLIVAARAAFASLDKGMLDVARRSDTPTRHASCASRCPRRATGSARECC